jgi:hypothetical protein
VFAQASSRLTAFSYFGALLAEPGDRKSCGQLAERAGHVTPRRMQALLAEYVWDWKAALPAWHSSTRYAVNRHRLTFHAGDTVLLAAGFLGRGAVSVAGPRGHHPRSAPDMN